MENETLTFNDLPMVVARLRDEVAGLKALLTGLQKSMTQQKNDNRRKPMNPREVAEYTGIPLGTIYQKLSLGKIPGIKSGKRWMLYPDEIDKWLEVQRKNPSLSPTPNSTPQSSAPTAANPAPPVTLHCIDKS